MGIYCPQTSTTYANLQTFHDAVAGNDYGQKVIGEVSGDVTAGVFLNGPYPNGLELRATTGEEFTGVEGVGACLLCPDSNNGIKFNTSSTGDPIEIYDLYFKNVSGYSSTIIDCSSYYKYDVFVERCGIFNRSNMHSFRKGVVASQNVSSVTPQTLTLKDCVVVANSNAIAVGGSRAGAGNIIVENCTVEGRNPSYPAFRINGTSCHAKNIFAFGDCSTDAEILSYGSLDYVATGDTTSNVVMNYLTGVSTTEFENFSGGDFRIKASSQLVGAGDAGGDIGAFVVVGSGVSGVLVSSNTASAITTGIKIAFGLAGSTNTSQTNIIALAEKFGLISSTGTPQSNVTGFATFLGYIISSATSQTTVTGTKDEFVNKLGSLLSANPTSTTISGFKNAFGVLSTSEALQTLITGFKSAFGVIDSTSNAQTTVTGTADELIFKSGFVVSSNIAQTIVDGFKTALGALMIAEATQTTTSGEKGGVGVATSTNTSTTGLMALAEKFGLLVSANNVTTLVIGYNPDSDNPIRRTQATGELAYYRIDGTLNRLEIAATL